MAKGRKVSNRNGKRAQTSAYRIGGIGMLASVTMNLVLFVFLVQGLYNHRPWLGYLDKEKEKEISGHVASEREKMVETKRRVNGTSTGTGSHTGADFIINLDHGDPTMFETFWKEVGDRATVVMPGWQTMSYFSDVASLCWFLEPEFAREVRRLHRIVGNAAVEDRHIIVGVGSTQLFQAALYALALPELNQPVSVVSAAPYYSSYPLVTDYLKSGLFQWAGDANTFKGENYIELVCSPNNPDGSLRESVLNARAGKTIHDLAYYWPQYTPIRGPIDHDIMLFTVSKSTGHAGTRLGWALVKDKDVARKMVKFIELNTIGVSKDSQIRAAKILKVVSDGYELPDSYGNVKLFDFGRQQMADRWRQLREAVRVSGIFSLPEFFPRYCEFTKETAEIYPAFAWLRCEDEKIEDCENFLRSHQIITRSGRHFGSGPDYVRISMLDRDETFDRFIKRIASLG